LMSEGRGKRILKEEGRRKREEYSLIPWYVHFLFLFIVTLMSEGRGKREVSFILTNLHFFILHIIFTVCLLI
jgi:hypothetical protein